MNRADIARLTGTIILVIVSAMPFGAGIWSLWTVLLSRLPMVIAIPALVGIVVAPIQLMRDLVHFSGRDGRPSA